MSGQEVNKNNHVIELLDAEASIISKISERVSAGWPEFCKAIEVMASTEGRIIFTGMGKSGHVATKITATMASLGKPSHFVHPAEASHGDLGMVTRGDTLVAFSNSGNTAELQAILNYARDIEIPIIGITMGAESTLGKAATIPLIIPQMKEGCHMRLAPTTSTTAQIALGDALAVGVSAMRDFNRDGFNKLHPGGSLGRSTSKVRDCMETGDDMPIAYEGAVSADLVWLMAQKRSDVAGVVDKENRLVGLVFAQDIKPTDNLSTEQLMRTVDPVVSADDSVATAISRMSKKAVKACFVLDDGKPVGMMRYQ